MADSKLSHEHSLALLHKLATDDGYRARYEQNPAAALAEVGIPGDTIIAFSAKCETKGTLASKEAFATAYRQLAAASADACVSMYVPSPQLRFDQKP